MWVYFEVYHKVIFMYRKTALRNSDARSPNRPTKNAITANERAIIVTRLRAALTSRAVSLTSDVKRRLGLLQYNWDIRPKPRLTHWGWVTHICVSKLSHYWTLDNGLAPIQCQTMIWSDIVSSTASLWTKEVQFQSKIQTFLFKKINFKMSSAKWHIFFICISMFNQI